MLWTTLDLENPAHVASLKKGDGVLVMNTQHETIKAEFVEIKSYPDDPKVWVELENWCETPEGWMEPGKTIEFPDDYVLIDEPKTLEATHGKGIAETFLPLQEAIKKANKASMGVVGALTKTAAAASVAIKSFGSSPLMKEMMKAVSDKENADVIAALGVPESYFPNVNITDNLNTDQLSKIADQLGYPKVKNGKPVFGEPLVAPVADETNFYKKPASDDSAAAILYASLAKKIDDQQKEKVELETELKVSIAAVAKLGETQIPGHWKKCPKEVSHKIYNEYCPSSYLGDEWSGDLYSEGMKTYKIIGSESGYPVWSEWINPSTVVKVVDQKPSPNPFKATTNPFLQELTTKLSTLDEAPQGKENGFWWNDKHDVSWIHVGNDLWRPAEKGDCKHVDGLTYKCVGTHSGNKTLWQVDLSNEVTNKIPSGMASGPIEISSADVGNVSAKETPAHLAGQAVDIESVGALLVNPSHSFEVDLKVLGDIHVAGSLEVNGSICHVAKIAPKLTKFATPNIMGARIVGYRLMTDQEIAAVGWIPGVNKGQAIVLDNGNIIYSSDEGVNRSMSLRALDPESETEWPIHGTEAKKFSAHDLAAVQPMTAPIGGFAYLEKPELGKAVKTFLKTPAKVGFGISSKGGKKKGEDDPWGDTPWYSHEQGGDELNPNIPEFNLDLMINEIEAKPKKMKGTWSKGEAQDLLADPGKSDEEIVVYQSLSMAVKSQLSTLKKKTEDAEKYYINVSKSNNHPDHVISEAHDAWVDAVMAHNKCKQEGGGYLIAPTIEEQEQVAADKYMAEIIAASKSKSDAKNKELEDLLKDL